MRESPSCAKEHPLRRTASSAAHVDTSPTTLCSARHPSSRRCVAHVAAHTPPTPSTQHRCIPSFLLPSKPLPPSCIAPISASAGGVATQRKTSASGPLPATMCRTVGAAASPRTSGCASWLVACGTAATKWTSPPKRRPSMRASSCCHCSRSVSALISRFVDVGGSLDSLVEVLIPTDEEDHQGSLR